VPADPAEAERRGGFVLLVPDRLHGSSRRLGDLCAAPEDQPDGRRLESGERLDVRQVRNRLVEPRQREVDEEDGHDDRQAAPELDVGADQHARRPEANSEQRAEHEPDRR
jgi:hypothetical protein